MSKKFIVSDTHWGHKNIIQYDNRPFASVEEMNEAMIKNWNSVVSSDDEVYHLGDFAFMTENQIENLIRRLNGKIHLIWGNHDEVIQKSKKLRDMFVWTRDYYILKDNGDRYVLFHFPIGEWDKCHRGAYHLHGHCHGNYDGDYSYRIMDVGASCINYTPIEISEVTRRLKNKKIKEHH